MAGAEPADVEMMQPRHGQPVRGSAVLPERWHFSSIGSLVELGGHAHLSLPAALGTAMTETKRKRRWFRFSINDLLLIMVISALATAWWLDHRRLRVIISSFESPEVREYLIDLNLSRDDEIAYFVRMRASLESMYDSAIAQMMPNQPTLLRSDLTK